MQSVSGSEIGCWKLSELQLVSRRRLVREFLSLSFWKQSSIPFALIQGTKHFSINLLSVTMLQWAGKCLFLIEITLINNPNTKEKHTRDWSYLFSAFKSVLGTGWASLRRGGNRRRGRLSFRQRPIPTFYCFCENQFRSGVSTVGYESCRRIKPLRHRTEISRKNLEKRNEIIVCSFFPLFSSSSSLLLLFILLKNAIVAVIRLVLWFIKPCKELRRKCALGKEQLFLLLHRRLTPRVPLPMYCHHVFLLLFPPSRGLENFSRPLAENFSQSALHWKLSSNRFAERALSTSSDCRLYLKFRKLNKSNRETPAYVVWTIALCLAMARGLSFSSFCLFRC